VLPSGTVTFLFTDIEGSTRILRELGDDLYSEILDLHDDILRRVWLRHGGEVVLTEGDAFFVAFANASDALAAAVDGQRALGDAAWPEGSQVLVRMGMHSGYGRPVNDDYRALAVHQAARVVDAANGGQILATADVVRLHDGTSAGSGLALGELGRYRVRDFDEPVALYQVVAPGLTVDPRPPRVRPADSHNLVRPTTSLVNRVAEQAELGVLIQPGSLVTLLGPGGAGKSRISIEVGFNTVDRWPDGVWFVELAPLSSGEVVPMAIANAVNAPSVPGNDAWSDLVAHLADRSLLIVLDNCEHLAESVAKLVQDLLQRCPDLGVLATSRIPLGLLAESLYRVDPLDTDDAESDAVRLFVERSGVSVDGDLSDIVELCRAVDGLPLAIELAATRAHLLTPAEMTERMSSGVAVVSTRDPTLPDRQRRLDRLLDWSLDLLDHDERQVLTRLSVVADGFDISLAETIAASEALPVERVSEIVWSLVDWSLVRRDVTAGTTRYSLLSTVRSHVRHGALGEELAFARSRLAGALMDRLGPGRTSSREWVTQMGIDLENVRAVVGHAEMPDEVARALAWSIGHYHDVRAMYRTGIAEIARCIGQRDSPGTDLVALLTLQADLHLRLGELLDAERIAERASALAEQVGVPYWDDMGVVRTQGEIALRSNDPKRAARLAADALSAGAATPRGQARLWNLAAIAHNTMSDLEAASAALDQCLRAEQAAGLETFLANTHGNYAEVLMALGDYFGAAEHQLQALDHARSMGQAVNIAFSCMLAARFALEDGRAGEAVLIQTGADAILDREGFSLYAGDEQQRVALLDAARRAVGPGPYEHAEADGRSMRTEQLADQAATILRQRVASSPRQGG
jgi:predicted ATPase/class 3 adenylate cyclase/tetratricopeptide (TPR) repeat protein